MRLPPLRLQMWQNADPGLADVCMAPDVQVWQPLMENSFTGLDKYTEQLEDHYAKARLLTARLLSAQMQMVCIPWDATDSCVFAQVWQPDGQYSHVAVSAGNLAFTFWISFGKDKPTGAKARPASLTSPPYPRPELAHPRCCVACCASPTYSALCCCTVPQGQLFGLALLGCAR